MKKAIVYVFMFLCTLPAFAQEWTEPVKINTLQGYNAHPDFYIANNGTIHCVWSYRLESNHRVIYYSKSDDDGLTWNTPENVSQNTSMWMENPHIVSDSENNLHLTYDYNTGNPGGTIIVYKKFDGNTWSPCDTVSVGWPGARHNRLVIDHNDKLYCFWFHDIQNGTTYYRILENNQWSDIMIPYDNNDLFFFIKGVTDSSNNIYCTGAHHYAWQSGYDDRIISFNFINNTWNNWVQLSDNTSWTGNDIALDNNNNPSIAWRQYTSNTIPPNDGTLYAKYNGNNWSYPEIVVEDPNYQAIAIDKYNNVHIIDNEKYEDGFRLVHYQQKNDLWVGKIIAENNYTYGWNSIIFKNNFLHLLHARVDTVIGSSSETTIVLRKYEVLVSTENNPVPFFTSFRIYPNPSCHNTNISYELEKTTNTEIKIYNLQGKLIKTLISKKQPPGAYKTKWNGTDKNGKEVNSGLYLIRLQAGRQVMTRSVEIIK